MQEQNQVQGEVPQPQPQAQAQPQQAQAQGGAPQAQAQVEYAGFFVRVAAAILDGFILLIPIALVSVIFGENLGKLLSYALIWGYAIYMLSNKGATLGKMAVGLKVTTEDGGMLSVGKASLREIVGKLVSGIILVIGFLMVAFTKKKQGLHDMIAGTIVVYDPTRKRRTWLVIVLAVIFFLMPIFAMLFGGMMFQFALDNRNPVGRGIEEAFTADYGEVYLPEGDMMDY